MIRILIFCLIFGANLVGDDVLDGDFSLGAKLKTGVNMGAGAEFGFEIYEEDNFWIYNYLSLNALGLKLSSDKYNSIALFAGEKVAFGYLLSSSVMSHIGFSFFRPYLFIGAGLGGVVGKRDIPKNTLYYEVFGGLGHEFISENGHVFYFEIGGGYMDLSKIYNLGGSFRVNLGYRKYF